MRTIETEAVITAAGQLTLEIPPDIPPGRHRVVVGIDEQPPAPGTGSLADFPVIDVGS